MRVPVKVVIDGVIDATSALAAKPDIQCRHAGVVEERSIVRAIAECRDAELALMPQIAAILRCTGAGNALQTRALPYRKLRLLGILNIAAYVVDESLQTMIA